MSEKRIFEETPILNIIEEPFALRDEKQYDDARKKTSGSIRKG